MINSDLELLNKKLYLDSPTLYVEFSDKIAEGIIDEMVLFFAIKYNVVSVLKFAIENNIINLDEPSKNNSYSSIKEHLIKVAQQYNCKDALNLLTGNCTVETTIQTPTFICQNCSSNLFEDGFRLIENSIYKFQDNKISKFTTKNEPKIICNKCEHIIDNVTFSTLENLCNIENCSHCGKNLTASGIFDKSILKFDNDKNKFISKDKSYHCSSCNNQLNETQIEYFNLK
jgi:DNA-directed RNA polymerase subunit RPC12/RpoP